MGASHDCSFLLCGLLTRAEMFGEGDGAGRMLIMGVSICRYIRSGLAFQGHSGVC